MPSSLFGMTNQINRIAINSGQTLNDLGQIKKLMGLVKNSNNPSAMLKTLAEQNPQVKNIMNYVNENGGDPKTAFYKLAKERGVDPSSILNMLK